MPSLQKSSWFPRHMPMSLVRHTIQRLLCNPRGLCRANVPACVGPECDGMARRALSGCNAATCGHQGDNSPISGDGRGWDGLWSRRRMSCSQSEHSSANPFGFAPLGRLRSMGSRQAGQAGQAAKSAAKRQIALCGE